MGNMHNMTIVTWHYCPCLNHSDGFQQPRVQLHSYLSDSVIMEQVLFHCLFAKMLCRNMKGDLSNSLTLREETPQTLWQAGLPAQRRVTAGRAGGSTTVSKASWWGEHSLWQSTLESNVFHFIAKKTRGPLKQLFSTSGIQETEQVERNRGEKQSSKVNASELICRWSSWVTSTCSSSAGYWYTVSFWKCPKNWRKLYNAGTFSIYSLTIAAQLAQLHKPFAFSTAQDSRMSCFKEFVVTVVIESSTVQP